MFCDKCGVKVIGKSTFCDKCGDSLLEKQNPKHAKTVQFIQLSTESTQQRLDKANPSFSIYQLVAYLSVIFLLISSYVIYNIYTNTQDQLRKTQNELASFRQATTDAVSAQKKLIEQQSESLSKQDEALKSSQANEVLLRKTLENVEKTKVSNVPTIDVSNTLLNEIAPSIVQVFCITSAYSEQLKQGSGMLRRASVDNAQFGPYYVQTNLHVVDTSDGSPSKCAIVVYPDSSDSNFYFVFQSNSYRFYNEDVDLAFLTPTLVSDNIHAGTINELSRFARDENKNPPCTSINIGDHLSILGYPGSGGDTLTITDGIVSGIEFDYQIRYIKTSAKIDSGNSGGIALNDSGCIVGIPTFVQRGTIESIGRILDLNYLYSVTLK